MTIKTLILINGGVRTYAGPNDPTQTWGAHNVHTLQFTETSCGEIVSTRVSNCLLRLFRGISHLNSKTDARALSHKHALQHSAKTQLTYTTVQKTFLKPLSQQNGSYGNYKCSKNLLHEGKTGQFTLRRSPSDGPVHDQFTVIFNPPKEIVRTYMIPQDAGHSSLGRFKSKCFASFQNFQLRLLGRVFAGVRVWRSAVGGAFRQLRHGTPTTGIYHNLIEHIKCLEK